MPKKRPYQEKIRMTSINYETALKSSLQYFNGDDLATKVFLDKYALRNKNQELLEATPDEMHRRIAREIARIEISKFKTPMTEDEIYSYLKDFKKIVPQGSSLSGIGNYNQYTSLSNCFLVDSPEDSYGGIHWSDQQLTQISKRRGGTGIDLSKLRPAGSPTSNAAKSSTGVIPFMRRYSNSIREVGQSGRRGALLISLSVHHPDILNFIVAKKTTEDITGANISIRLTDEFLDAVAKEEEYEVRWPVEGKKPKISFKLKAQDVWKLIIQNAWNSGEPGLLFWDTIIKESPADCYATKGFKSEGCNPCSEIILSPLDSCRLLLINLFSYIKKPFTTEAYFDKDEFYHDTQIAQRIADDIIDLELECIDRIIGKIEADPENERLKFVELFTWKQVKESCTKGRRTGTGLTGLGDTLAALNIKYASEESLKTVDEIYQTLKLGVYRGSVDIAKELGAFPVWDQFLETKNPFLLRIKKEAPELWSDMQKYGRRNIACLTSSPSGSMSILTGTTSGIEPLFNLQYTRRKKVNPEDTNVRIDFVDKTGDAWQNFDVYHPRLVQWMSITGECDIKKSPWYGCCASEINWENRVKLQSVATKHIDHSISSTINLPERATVEDVAKIYETAWQSGIKGITVYRENSRIGVLVNKESSKDDCDDCKKPNRSDIKSINKTHAPKRPKELPCDIYHVTVKGEIYFVIVGLLAGEPYEIFAGKNGQIKKSADKALLRKVKRGFYDLILSDNTEVPNLGNYSNEDQEALTRMISISLRHGADISFVVHQLEKVKGDLQSLAKAVARSLKKYIKEQTLVTGETCENCKMENTLVREQGCVVCKQCGWSKCN